MTSLKTFQDKKKMLYRIDRFTDKYPAEMISIEDAPVFEAWSDVWMEYHSIKKMMSQEELWKYMTSE